MRKEANKNETPVFQNRLKQLSQSSKNAVIFNKAASSLSLSFSVLLLHLNMNTRLVPELLMMARFIAVGTSSMIDWANVCLLLSHSALLFCSFYRRSVLFVGVS